MSYVTLAVRPRYASFSGLLDDVQVNPDGTLNIPSVGLSKLDLTKPDQFLAAQGHVDQIIGALPIDLGSVVGGDASGAWSGQVVAVVQAVASGNIRGVAEQAVKAGLTAGGAAACAATGAGAAVAPMCGAVAGLLAPVVMKVGEAVVEGVGQIFGMKTSAEKERERLAAAAEQAYDQFVAAKEKALVGLAKLEQAIADETKYAAAAAFAKLRGIAPPVSGADVLAKMRRDAGGAFDPDAPMEPDTGFTARQIATQKASKALYDAVMKDKAGAEFFLRAFASIGPTIAKRYQYPGPVPRDGRAPNQVDFVPWWSNMPPDVWQTSLMAKGKPLDFNTSAPGGRPLPCRLRSFSQDDPANGWAGFAPGKTYTYAFPSNIEYPPGNVLANVSEFGAKVAAMPDAADASDAVIRWNIAAWNTLGQQGNWAKYNNGDYVRARIAEMWAKRVNCQITAHADAFRAACQFQLGEMVKAIVADDMRLRLKALRGEQERKKKMAPARDAGQQKSATDAEAVRRSLTLRTASAEGGGSAPMLLLGGAAIAGGVFIWMKSKKRK